MYKLPYTPQQQGYVVNKPNSTISTSISGGSPRYKLDFLNGSQKLNVGWQLDRSGYRYLNKFYNIVCQSGSLPFLIDLYMDEDVLTEHTARFVPESFQLAEQQGDLFVIKAQLDVQPKVVTAEDELEFLIELNYGRNYRKAFDRLDWLINDEMPPHYQHNWPGVYSFNDQILRINNAVTVTMTRECVSSTPGIIYIEPLGRNQFRLICTEVGETYMTYIHQDGQKVTNNKITVNEFIEPSIRVFGVNQPDYATLYNRTYFNVLTPNVVKVDKIDSETYKIMGGEKPGKTIIKNKGLVGMPLPDITCYVFDPNYVHETKSITLGLNEDLVIREVAIISSDSNPGIVEYSMVWNVGPVYLFTGKHVGVTTIRYTPTMASPVNLTITVVA